MWHRRDGEKVRTGCTADEEASLSALGQAEHVQGSHEGGLNRLDGVVLVMRGGGGARKMVDLYQSQSEMRRDESGCKLTVALNHERLNDIVSNELKVGVTDPVGDGSLGTSEEVVKDGNLVAEEHESVDEMGANKTSTAGHQDALPLGGREKLDGGEANQGRVRNGAGVSMEDGL